MVARNKVSEFATYPEPSESFSDFEERIMYQKFLTIVAILLILQIVSAQQPLKIDRETNVQGCMTKHFRPSYTALWSEKKQGVDIVRCNSPSELICDISAGIKHRNYEGISCLIGADFDFNVENGELLVEAAYYDVRMLELLLDGQIQIDLEARDKTGNTPLLRIAKIVPSGLVNRGRGFSWENISKSLEELLKHGADPDSKNSEGMTPLLYSAVYKQTRNVELLILYNADVNIQTQDGKTAMMLVEDNREIVSKLIEAGADVNLRDVLGRSALFYAIDGCQVNKVRALLTKNPRTLHVTDFAGRTPADSLKSSRSTIPCRETIRLIRESMGT